MPKNEEGQNGIDTDNGEVNAEGQKHIDNGVVNAEGQNVIDIVNKEVSKEPTLAINLKLCRLCETKEGLFLDILENDKTAKQIENLLQLKVSKTDGLPHTVCAVCVAKVDEINEFIEKCIKTRENLVLLFGNDSRSLPKAKSEDRLCSEEKFVATNKPHESFSNEVIKRAMQAVTNTPDITQRKKLLSFIKKRSNVGSSNSQESDDEVYNLTKLTITKNSVISPNLTRPQTLRASPGTKRNSVTSPKEDVPVNQKLQYKANAGPSSSQDFEDEVYNLTKLKKTKNSMIYPNRTRSQTLRASSRTKRNSVTSPKEDVPVSQNIQYKANAGSSNSQDFENEVYKLTKLNITKNSVISSNGTISQTLRASPKMKRNHLSSPKEDVPVSQKLRSQSQQLTVKLIKPTSIQSDSAVTSTSDIMFEKDEKNDSVPLLDTISYKCNSCNQNFVNKQVVVSHSCVKISKKSEVQEEAPRAQSEVPIPASSVSNNSDSNNTENSVSDNDETGEEQTKASIPTMIRTDRQEKQTKASIPTMTPAQLENYFVIVRRPGNRLILEKKIDVGVENLPKQKPHTSSSTTQKPHTVTSATSSESSSNEPYASDGVASSTHRKPLEVSVLSSKYPCIRCNKKLGRQLKLRLMRMRNQYLREAGRIRKQYVLNRRLMPALMRCSCIRNNSSVTK